MQAVNQSYAILVQPSLKDDIHGEKVTQETELGTHFSIKVRFEFVLETFYNLYLLANLKNSVGSASLVGLITRRPCL